MNKIILSLKYIIIPKNFYRFYTVLTNNFFNIKEPIFEDQKHLESCIAWLLEGHKAAEGKGFSAFYSLISGWGRPYPETTGYLIPTLLSFTKFSEYKKEEIINAVKKSAEWLLSIQNENGSFNDLNGTYEVAFDSGQILFGLLAVYKYTNEKKYIDSSKKTADWLCKNQEKDGYWEKCDYNNLRHAYSSRIAWALLEIYKVIGDTKYRDAAEKNLNWVTGQQEENGWFKCASFFKEEKSVLHTIAYTIEGLLESGKILNKNRYIACAKKAADVLIELNKKNIISGFYNNDWTVAEKSKCLAGLIQMGKVWLGFFEITEEKSYFVEALKIIDFIKGIQDVSTKDKNLIGAIPGSYPLWGKYFPLAYPNWAAKFFIDILLLNQKIKDKNNVDFYQG